MAALRSGPGELHHEPAVQLAAQRSFHFLTCHHVLAVYRNGSVRQLDSHFEVVGGVVEVSQAQQSERAAAVRYRAEPGVIQDVRIARYDRASEVNQWTHFARNIRTFALFGRLDTCQARLRSVWVMHGRRRRRR